MRPTQFLLEVHLMVELDGPRILLAAPQRREFRMVPIEIADLGHKPWWSVLIFRRKIGVALRASAVAGAGQAQHALVLHVAIRTRRRKRLLPMMDGPVVTSQASLIGDGPLESGGGDVASGAFLSNQGMRVRHRSGIVGRGTSAQCVPAQ